jgi:hypothetical protein
MSGGIEAEERRETVRATVVQNGQDWADIIDFLTMHPEARRQVVRLLGEIGAVVRSRRNDAGIDRPEPSA